MSNLPTLTSVSAWWRLLLARCARDLRRATVPVPHGMKFLKQITLATLLVLGACRGESKRPANVLSQQEMVRVLSDVLVLEEKVTRLGLTGDSALIVFNTLKGKVFENAGVPDSVFKKSMDYYIDHPEELEQVYSVLVDSLNLREQRASIRPELK